MSHPSDPVWRRPVPSAAELLELENLAVSLAEETGRLRENLTSFDVAGREAADRAGRVLAELISELTEEAEAA